MTQKSDMALDIDAATHEWLHAHYASVLSANAITSLTAAIAGYVRRSRYPAQAILPHIAQHYIVDGARVHALLADSYAEEWQTILHQVMTFAKTHPYYPSIEDATSAPDLDAYEDIRRNLGSYNFECSLDGWINTVVLRRLLRFWRDRQSLRSGGNGFLSKAALEAQRNGDQTPPARRVSHVSLDQLAEEGTGTQHFESRQPAIQDTVESIVLEVLVEQVVSAFATQVGDSTLPTIWRAIVMEDRKLREVAADYNLTISQVHYRIRRVSAHLSNHPEIVQWFEAATDSFEFLTPESPSASGVQPGNKPQ